jgi:hypothetical protein
VSAHTFLVMENQQGGPPDVASQNKKHPVVSKHFFADYLLRLPDAFLPLNFFWTA